MSQTLYPMVQRKRRNLFKEPPLPLASPQPKPAADEAGIKSALARATAPPQTKVPATGGPVATGTAPLVGEAAPGYALPPKQVPETPPKPKGGKPPKGK